EGIFKAAADEPAVIGLRGQAQSARPATSERNIVVHAVEAGLRVAAVDVSEKARGDQHAGATAHSPFRGFFLTSCHAREAIAARYAAVPPLDCEAVIGVPFTVT